MIDTETVREQFQRFSHAAAVWKVSRDPPQTLALIREARDHDLRDLTNELRTSAFADVQDDPEFMPAISRSG